MRIVEDVSYEAHLMAQRRDFADVEAALGVFADQEPRFEAIQSTFRLRVPVVVRRKRGRQSAGCRQLFHPLLVHADLNLLRSGPLIRPEATGWRHEIEFSDAERIGFP